MGNAHPFSSPRPGNKVLYKSQLQFDTVRAMSFYITVSSAAFKSDFPANTATSFKFALLSRLDLRGWEVAVTEQHVFNPVKEYQTVYIVTSNLVTPRPCNNTSLPVLRIGKISAPILQYQYVPCVAGQVDTIDINLIKVAGADLQSGSILQLTLHFQRRTSV